MTTNPLDEIQARADKGMAALADYGDGKRDVMSTMIRLTDTAEDAGKLIAALRTVEAVHRTVHYDKWARKHESPQGHGGWCSSCGRFDGEGCPTITAIREALA